MEKLLELKEQIQNLLKVGHPDPDFVKVAKVVLAAVDALLAKKSLAKKTQAIADELIPLVRNLPPLQAYRAVIDLLEPHLGEAVQWLGDELAPPKVIDKQDGPIVHDEGQEAPIV